MAWARIKKTHCFEHLFADILSLLPVHDAARTNIDRWMLYVTRNGVKELILAGLRNSNYRIPSHVIDNTTSDNVEEVWEYQNSTVCLNQPLHSVKDVVMHAFEGSKVEMLFVKLLFDCTPSLIRMQVNVFDMEEGRDIATELMD
ncbi:hypothetical protein KY285_019177 [Solanum tuberosum]|nr:hypothetical protein KY285_019177 [Solanum tuberosum]